MKQRIAEYVFAIGLMLCLLLGIAWLAGFPDWGDPFAYDHPENFTRHIIWE